MQHIFSATIRVLKQPRCALLCIAVALIFFALFIAVPVFTTPGNSFGFQLSIFRTWDYALMSLLALLVGLNSAFVFQTWRQKRNVKKTSLAHGAVTGLSGIFGAVVGTAACASCLAALFGLIGLGTGSVFFVLKNQPYFLLGAIAFMLVSLYFSARKINKVCTSC